MSCEWVREHIDEYELGRLGARERQHLEAHLASCEACRKLAAEARSADEAIRAALAWAEPEGSFSEELVTRARRPARRWWLAAAAAAAILCAALIYGTYRPPGREVDQPPEARAAVERLLAGKVRDAYGLPVERLEHGRAYVAAAHTAIDVGRRSLFLLARGTQFEPAPERTLAMSVHAGTMLGQVDRGHRELSVELAPELGGAIVRTTGCQFYSTGAPLHWLAQGRALARWPEEIRVHVFTGKLEVNLGAQKLELSQGDSAIIWGGVSAGSTRMVEARARALRLALSADLLARRRRYRRLRDHYARRLLELRSATGGDAPLYLPERLALLDGLLRAHARALSRLEADLPDFFELDAAEAELERLERLRERAEEALERFMTLIGTAG